MGGRRRPDTRAVIDSVIDTHIYYAETVGDWIYKHFPVPKPIADIGRQFKWWWKPFRALTAEEWRYFGNFISDFSIFVRR